MARYQFLRPVRRALLDELVAAGFAPALPDGTPRLVFLDDRCWVEAEPAEYDRVAAVVAAHDAAALDAQAATQQQQVADALASLRQFRGVASGSATNAQRDNAIKALMLLMRQLYRDLN